jgi:hypothetical protein
MALTCAEVEDLAALYILDALSTEEAAAVAAHLATCAEPHPSFAELAPLGPAIALSAEPVDAPAGLRAHVMAAVATTPQVPDALPGVAGPVNGAFAPTAPIPPAPKPGPSLWERLIGGANRGWVAAAAVGLVLVLVGLGLVTTLQRDGDDPGRTQLLAAAIHDAASGEATVATLTGSGAAADAAGYAVFPDDGPGYIVVSGLPPLPSDEAFQAWYIADGEPVSAGLLELSADGLGTLEGLEAVDGTSVVALTVESRPGADAPTSEPVILGELPAAA